MKTVVLCTLLVLLPCIGEPGEPVVKPCTKQMTVLPPEGCELTGVTTWGGNMSEPGAVVLEDCPNRWHSGRSIYAVCYCDPCRICGYSKHTAIHGPRFGGKAGDIPWGHEYREP